MLTFLFFLIFSPIVFLIIVAIPFQFFKLLQKPKLNRNWIDLHKQVPEIIVEGDRIKFKNLRHAHYDEEGYPTKIDFYNCITHKKDLKEIWIYINPFGTIISHLMLSLNFNGKFIAVSVEVRKTEDMIFNFFKTCFFNYEIFYCLGDEADFFWSKLYNRSGNSDAYLYKLDLTDEQIDIVFANIVKNVNSYSKKAKFYSPFTRNCVTENMKNIKGVFKYFPKTIFYNFYLLYFFYTSGKVKNAPKKYKQFLKMGNISKIVEKLNQDDHFSYDLRKTKELSVTTGK